MNISRRPFNDRDSKLCDVTVPRTEGVRWNHASFGASGISSSENLPSGSHTRGLSGSSCLVKACSSGRSFGETMYESLVLRGSDIDKNQTSVPGRRDMSLDPRVPTTLTL